MGMRLTRLHRIHIERMSHKKLDMRGSPSRLIKDADWETTGSEV